MAMYHDGSRRAPGPLRQPADRRPARAGHGPRPVHRRRPRVHRARPDVLPRHRRRRGPAGLLVQGRAARLRARRRRAHARRSRATTATACSGASATCSSIRRSACCSSTSRARSASASTASRHVHEDDALLAAFAGAQLIVRVRAERIFPNCPALHPQDEGGRALRVLASPGSRAAGAGLEADGRLPGLPPRSEAMSGPVTHVI